jgi:hypothetical protein
MKKLFLFRPCTSSDKTFLYLSEGRGRITSFFPILEELNVTSLLQGLSNELTIKVKKF